MATAVAIYVFTGHVNMRNK